MAEFYDQRSGLPGYRTAGGSGATTWLAIAAIVLFVVALVAITPGGDTTVEHPGGAGAPPVAVGDDAAGAYGGTAADGQ